MLSFHSAPLFYLGHSLQRAYVCCQPDLDFGNAEAGVRRAETYITSADQIHPSSNTSTMNSGDHRLRAPFHCVEGGLIEG